MYMLDYMEVRLALMVAGTALTLPTNWYIAPLSAFTDAGVTEITGAGLTRFSMARSLANWSGTQGTGTTLASTGTSHTTSNNIEIDFGTASGSATMTAIGFFDASSSGNCWMVWPLDEALSIASSDDVTLAAGLVRLILGAGGGMTDYLANKMIDLIFRGQAYSFPATLYDALFTTAPTNAGGGTEVGGGVGYMRLPIAAADWDASGDTAENSDALSYPPATGSQGTINAHALMDLASLGNMLFWEAVTPRTVVSGSPALTYGAGAISIRFA